MPRGESENRSGSSRRHRICRPQFPEVVPVKTSRPNGGSVWHHSIAMGSPLKPHARDREPEETMHPHRNLCGLIPPERCWVTCLQTCAEFLMFPPDHGRGLRSEPTNPG